jgi:hypothetical protein
MAAFSGCIPSRSGVSIAGMTLRSRAWLAWLALIPCAACIAGCSKTTTTPEVLVATRAVSAVLVDSTGAPIPGALVFAGQLTSGSHAQATEQVTDAAGVAHFGLPDGSWCLSTVLDTSTPPLVAASTGTVAAPAPPGSDTVEFRLVARREAVARGTITLPGQAYQDGTIVTLLNVPTFTTTELDGSYVLGTLPPGHWTAVAAHIGYQVRQFAIVVNAPGDTITAGTSFSLTPGGPVPRP